MKRMLWLLVSVLLISTAAMADHIGIYSDATGSSCKLVVGFSSTATIIQKFSYGSTGSRWRIEASSGVTIFAFNTPFVTYGTITDDLSIGYGPCLANTFTGGIVLGTLLMSGTDAAQVRIAGTFWTNGNIIVTDCNFGEHNASGGIAYFGHECQLAATEAATWGRIKALYR